ncbi:MAG TPA: murein biosynthesis integral membrane protein MurJ [Pseudobdellovibrionaceae bacterium]|nr:murein biosynthesis integral membrane protein MurJ [Pseudobdellovibrionaceae bacterium]
MSRSPHSSENSTETQSVGRQGPLSRSVASVTSVARSASLVALGTLASRVLGLLRDMLLARHFPPEVRDAFVVAFRLPNIFRRLFGEGVLAASFLPSLVSALTRPTSPGEATRLVGAVFTLLLSLTSLISLLGIVFMDELMRLLLSGGSFDDVPGKFQLTVDLARIMFGFVALVSIYAFFMAVLNSLHRFALAAVAPCLFNLSLIVAILGFRGQAQAERALAWSVIVGGALQMLILVPAIRRARHWPKLGFFWSSPQGPQPVWTLPEVQKVFAAMGPSLLGLGVLQVMTVLNVIFASRLPQGAHTAIYLADRLFELPLSLIAVSVGSAMLPTLSGQWAAGDTAKMTATLRRGLRFVLFLALPSAVGLFMLAEPITEVLFQGREFRYADVLMTSQVIRVSAIGLVMAAVVKLLAQGFFAVGNTWFPAVAGLVTLACHAVFAWAGTRTMGLVGLTAATVLSSLVNAVLLGLAYSKWVGPLQWRQTAGLMLKLVLACVALAAGCLIYEPLVLEFGSRFLTRSVALAAAIGLASALYFIATAILRVPELNEFAARTRELITARLRRSATKS